MKKLLILSGVEINKIFVEAAKELGIYTIVTDYDPDSPAKAFADEAIDISLLDPEGLIEYCKENNVDSVANFTNTLSTETQFKVAEAIGCPTFGNEEQLACLTEKVEFKKICQKYGVDTIPEYTEEEVIAGDIKYPIIIKPDVNSGSKGATICYNHEEALKGIEIAKDNTLNDKIIIEQYLTGLPDFMVFYYFIDGEAYVIGSGDRILGREEDGLQRQCICGVCPSVYQDLFIEKADEQCKKMFKEIGIENGPVFLQGLVDGDKFRFYDPGIRFCGGGLYEMVHKDVTGADIIKASVEYCVYGKTSIDTELLSDSYNMNGKTLTVLMSNLKPGTVGKIEGLDEIREFEEVVDIFQFKEVGDTVEQTGDITQRLCDFILCLDNDKTKINEIIQKIQSIVVCEDSNGEDMLISKVTPEDILNL